MPPGTQTPTPITPQPPIASIPQQAALTATQQQYYPQTPVALVPQQQYNFQQPTQQWQYNPQQPSKQQLDPGGGTTLYNAWLSALSSVSPMVYNNFIPSKAATPLVLSLIS